jgi:hypothetical protein
MAVTPGLEWWVVAALTAAAEAFEKQARDWGGAPREASHRPTERESERQQTEQVRTWFPSSAHGDGQ